MDIILVNCFQVTNPEHTETLLLCRSSHLEIDFVMRDCRLHLAAIVSSDESVLVPSACRGCHICHSDLFHTSCLCNNNITIQKICRQFIHKDLQWTRDLSRVYSCLLPDDHWGSSTTTILIRTKQQLLENAWMDRYTQGCLGIS